MSSRLDSYESRTRSKWSTYSLKKREPLLPPSLPEPSSSQPVQWSYGKDGPTSPRVYLCNLLFFSRGLVVKSTVFILLWIFTSCYDFGLYNACTNFHSGFPFGLWDSLMCHLEVVALQPPVVWSPLCPSSLLLTVPNYFRLTLVSVHSKHTFRYSSSLYDYFPTSFVGDGLFLLTSFHSTSNFFFIYFSTLPFKLCIWHFSIPFY